MKAVDISTRYPRTDSKSGVFPFDHLLYTEKLFESSKITNFRFPRAEKRKKNSRKGKTGGGETHNDEFFEVAGFEKLEDVREDGAVGDGEQRLRDLLPLEDHVNGEGGLEGGFRKGRKGNGEEGPWRREGRASWKCRRRGRRLGNPSGFFHRGGGTVFGSRDRPSQKQPPKEDRKQK